MMFVTLSERSRGAGRWLAVRGRKQRSTRWFLLVAASVVGYLRRLMLVRDVCGSGWLGTAIMVAVGQAAVEDI
jgi:hypothetical protein